MLIQPDDQQCKRRDQSRRRWDRETQELLAAAAAHGRKTIEAGQSKCAAHQINRSDKPAPIGVRSEVF